MVKKINLVDVSPMALDLMSPVAYEELKHIVDIYNDLKVASLAYKFFRDAITHLLTTLPKEDRVYLNQVLQKFEQLIKG